MRANRPQHERAPTSTGHAPASRPDCAQRSARRLAPEAQRGRARWSAHWAFPAHGILAGILLLLLASCGTTTGSASQPQPGNFDGARSLSCSNPTGLEALYWDFMNGIIRTDYPDTWRFLPYAPGSSFIHPVQPLYSFIYPSHWTLEPLTNPASQLTGANVIRPDGQAVWRRLNYTLGGAVSATDALNSELQGMLGFLGNPGQVQTVCFIEDAGRSAALVRAGEFTANLSVQAFTSGGLTVIFAQVAVAPTADYAFTALNAFFPLSGQMNLGGGSSDPECSDGVDNDGDGQTDYPDDGGCTSELDDSEAG